MILYDFKTEMCLDPLILNDINITRTPFGYVRYRYNISETGIHLNIRYNHETDNPFTVSVNGIDLVKIKKMILYINRFSGEYLLKTYNHLNKFSAKVTVHIKRDELIQLIRRHEVNKVLNDG